MVTVDFYRNLPSLGYDLIIFRVHSTGVCREEYEPGDFVILFTSESYSRTSHLHEQITRRLAITQFPYDNQLYFGITPTFVSDSMNGKFKDTTIIMMGCDGLKYTSMAKAFINRGAGVYIGWDGPITADHTDQATTRLLHHLLLQKQTIQKAVTETMNEIGADPTGSTLKYYPPEAGSYTISHNTYNIHSTITLATVMTIVFINNDSSETFGGQSASKWKEIMLFRKSHNCSSSVRCFQGSFSLQ